MRKIALVVALLLLPMFSLLGLTGCNSADKLEVIKLSEVTHSVFYAPMYIAQNKGYFADEGLEVQISNGNGSNNVMTAVISGQAHIGLAGPETVIYNAVANNKDKPKVFGQLTACDGSFLISRQNEVSWEPSDVAGKTLVAGRRGGMPAMTLQYGLHLAGMEAGRDYTLDLGVDFGLVAGAFEGGRGDYCTMFEPTASSYESEGKGYIVASVGELGGTVPYTAFIANENFLKDKSLTSERFLRAIYRGFGYLMTADIDDVVDAVMPSFVGSNKNHIKSAILNYMDIGAFAYSPVMTQDSYNRLVEIVKFAGELDQNANVQFGDVIDNTIAKKTVSYFNLV